MGGWRTQSVILSCLVASYNIHADVWQHMLMTHHNNDRPITIQETQNVMNDWRISAHLFSEESDGKLLGWSGCSWSHDLTNPNIGLMSLRNCYPVQGTRAGGRASQEPSSSECMLKGRASNQCFKSMLGTYA